MCRARLSVNGGGPWKRLVELLRQSNGLNEMIQDQWNVYTTHEKDKILHKMKKSFERKVQTVIERASRERQKSKI